MPSIDDLQHDLLLIIVVVLIIRFSLGIVPEIAVPPSILIP